MSFNAGISGTFPPVSWKVVGKKGKSNRCDQEGLEDRAVKLVVGGSPLSVQAHGGASLYPHSAVGGWS